MMKKMPAVAGGPKIPVPPPAPKKRKCPYGAECFRKNPEHFKEFCHPGDAEYEQQKNYPQQVPQQTTAPPTTITTATTTTAAAADDSDCADPNDPTKCKFGQMCFRTDPA